MQDGRLDATLTRKRIRYGPIDVEYDDRVLEPRLWTLEQAAWAAELSGGGKMAEFGSGAGQIGLAAAAWSGKALVQIDRDPVACEWATHNAAANGLARRAEQRCGTPGQMLGPHERFAVIVADPPYISSSEISRFPEDPVGAIDGGPDGLDAIREFLRSAVAHLERGGSVILQTQGERQIAKVAAWLRQESIPLDIVDARHFDADRSLALLRG